MPKAPPATGAFWATGISKAIPLQTIAGSPHCESEPVTKRGTGGAVVGYQTATGNDSPVSGSRRSILRYPTFQGGAAPAIDAAQSSRITGTSPVARSTTA